MLGGNVRAQEQMFTNRIGNSADSAMTENDGIVILFLHAIITVNGHCIDCGGLALE